jgi:hypothetical protein
MFPNPCVPNGMTGIDNPLRPQRRRGTLVVLALTGAS